jgi:hypothetical protein
MSHFAVAVFTKEGGKTVEELLAPYQENNMDDCPEEYLQFTDKEDDYREEYEKDSIEMVKSAESKMVFP